MALLRLLDCTSEASEAALAAGGDDVTFDAVFATMLNADVGESVRFLVRHLAADLPLARRVTGDEYFEGGIAHAGLVRRVGERN